MNLLKLWNKIRKTSIYIHTYFEYLLNSNILFVRQNYFDAKSLPSILLFVGIVSACFAVLQYLYPDMNGFIIAGIGVSVGMAMFKDQFSTVFINNSSARMS